MPRRNAVCDLGLSFKVQTISPVEFQEEHRFTRKKITINQINSKSYTEFSEEYENDLAKLCLLGKKSYRQFFILFLFLFIKGSNRPTGKNYDKAIK